MAKIDVSTIEGYEEMTAEEKLAALEGFELPEPDYTGYVKKELFDKASSEIAGYKKQIFEKMTAEEVEKDFEGFREEFKWQLIKSAILKAAGKQVEDADVKACARELAAAQLQQYGLYGMTDEQLDGFADRLLQDERQREGLLDRAVENKVFAVVKESVKLDEQSISMDDFQKLFEK